MLRRDAGNNVDGFGRHSGEYEGDVEVAGNLRHVLLGARTEHSQAADGGYAKRQIVAMAENRLAGIGRHDLLHIAGNHQMLFEAADVAHHPHTVARAPLHIAEQERRQALAGQSSEIFNVERFGCFFHARADMAPN